MKFFPPTKWGKKHASHQEVLKKTGSGGGSQMRDWLAQLVKLREHADYHSWLPNPPSVKSPPPSCDCSWGPVVSDNSEFAIDLADKLLQELDSLP